MLVSVVIRPAYCCLSGKNSAQFALSDKSLEEEDSTSFKLINQPNKRDEANTVLDLVERSADHRPVKMVPKYSGEDALAYQEGPADPTGPINYVQKRLQKRKGVEVVFDPKSQK